MRRPLLSALLLAALAPSTLADPTPGFLETWPGTSVQEWTAGVGGQTTNPGTGGWGGDGDGFLHVARTDFVHHFGGRARDLPAYSGDWIAAGIVQMRLALRDVDTNQDFQIHVCVGNPGNFWQYDPAFLPPDGAWQEFTVDFRDSTAFTQIIGTDSFSAMLHEVNTVLVRHDLPPFVKEPESISGELGIDQLQLLDEALTPVTLATWGSVKRRYR